MGSRLVDALGVKASPIAVIWTDSKPEGAIQFKENRQGCVAAMMVAASKGRQAVFDRKSYGCPGGGVGLGFGDRYGSFPIHCLLSTGNKEWAARMGGSSYMADGERFFRNADVARRWVATLPLTDVPADYVLLKPLPKVTDQDDVRLVIFLVNGDQLSALVVMADYDRGTNQSVIAPFGAACQSILYGYAEAQREYPRGIIGYFDIAQRRSVAKDMLSFTIPYRMFLEMENNVAGSFLGGETWAKIRERQ